MSTAADAALAARQQQQQQQGQGARLRLPLQFGGGRRPAQLRLCKTWEECGQCWTVSCVFCHGREEQAEREEA